MRDLKLSGEKSNILFDLFYFFSRKFEEKIKNSEKVDDFPPRKDRDNSMPCEDSLDGPDHFMYWVEENRLIIQWENEEIQISWNNMFYILNIYIKMIKIMLLPRQKIPKDVESNDLINANN